MKIRNIKQSTVRNFVKPVFTIALLSLTGMGLSFADVNPRNNWGLTPLGPDIPKPQWKPAPIKQPLKSQRQVLPASGESLLLANENQAQAVLVLPQNVSSSAKEAAELLQRVFLEISGATLPIVSEGKIEIQENTGKQSFQVDGKSYAALIAIGDTLLAKTAHVNADDLKLDGYRLKTQGNILFIVGQDRSPRLDHEGNPIKISNNGVSGYVHANGTRHGAYALLEQYFGCRWLWPAEAGGEILPKQKNLVLQPLNESNEPAIAQRIIRNYYPEDGANSYGRRQQQSVLPLLDRSYSNLLSKAKNSGSWFQAMGLGQSAELKVGHAFSGYWTKYGESHPEYFALQADGTRNQVRRGPEGASRARLDVTNDELIQTIAQDVIGQFDADPNLVSASIAPNDGSYPSFCLCEICRRLDPPQGDPIGFSIVDKEDKASRITYPSLTDRYVTFYSKIAEKVAEKHPDRLLGAYAYSTYSSPPHYAKLAPNVFISYVGLSYFNEAQRQQDLRSWDIWAASGGQMQLRPNALLGLYGIPAVFAHKLGEDIKHLYQTGMIGTDFDALTHDWAGRGLNYYVLAKLLWDPSQNVDEIIKDYCDAGFGAASPQIQKYFAELEDLTNEIAANIGDSARTEDGLDSISIATSLRIMIRSYTPERIEKLQSILNEAKQQTEDGNVLARIEFLSQGLRYARVETAALRAYTKPESATKKAQIEQVLQERKRVFEDIYDNHFYAQSIFPTLHRTASLWRPFDLDGLGGELKK